MRAGRRWLSLFLLGGGLVCAASTACAPLPMANGSARAPAPVVPVQDPSLAAAGVVTLAVGSSAFVGGVFVSLAGLLSDCQAGYFLFPSCSGNSTAITVGGVMMIAGGVLALISIPMIVVGNKKALDTAPRASFVVGPSRVGLSVSF